MPERTVFVRFRKALLAAELDGRLFEVVNEQLRARAVTVRTGTLIDATVIASASEGDGEAGWSGHRARKAIHSYKAHVAADADTGLVERVDVTPGNVHGGRAGGAVVPEDPGEVFADSAYRGTQFAEAVRIRGGTPRVVATHYWAREGDVAAEKAFLARNGRYSASARASRRSSAPGSAVAGSAACDGWGWRRQPCRSA